MRRFLYICSAMNCGMDRGLAEKEPPQEGMETTASSPGLPTGQAEAEKDIKDLAGGAAVTFLGKIARVSRGAFIWVVTLLFGLDVLALYSLAWGLVATLNRVGRFGLQRGVVRFVVEARTRGDAAGAERVVATALGIGLVAGAAVAIAVFLSADWVAAFYDKPVAPALRILAWSAPFIAVAWIFIAAVRALRIVRYGVYVMSVAGPLILLAGGLVAGFTAPSLENVAWVQFAMAVGICLLAAFYFQRLFSLPHCLSRLGRGFSWKALTRFSFPVMLTDLLQGLLTQLDVLMLGWFVPKEQIYLVGVYVLARRIASAMLKAPQAFDPIFGPVVSELTYREQHQELAHRFVVVSRWILTVNLPVFAGILIVGDHILVLLSGTQVAAAAEIEVGIKILFLLCIGMMVQGTFALIGPMLAMSGRPYLNLFNNSLWLAANFLLNFWLIGRYGIVGAALGATLSMLLVNILRLAQVQLIYHIRPFRRSQLKPLVAAFGAALAAWLSEDVFTGMVWSTAGVLAVFLGVYISLLYLLGMEAEDRVLMRRIRHWIEHHPQRRKGNQGENISGGTG